LVPTDFSSGAEAALQRALDLRQLFGCTLTLFHAYELPIMYVEGYAFTPDLLNTIEDSARKEMQRVKSAAEARARELGAGGASSIDSKIAIGGPAVAITEEAKAGDYDLIVMGTHGRTGLSHLLIGSVAERVVRTARCPVLTVRAG
jgi:nucleotide-binding universal stress UspA family protein